VLTKKGKERTDPYSEGKASQKRKKGEKKEWVLFFFWDARGFALDAKTGEKDEKTDSTVFGGTKSEGKKKEIRSLMLTSEIKKKRGDHPFTNGTATKDGDGPQCGRGRKMYS